MPAVTPDNVTPDNNVLLWDTRLLGDAQQARIPPGERLSAPVMEVVAIPAGADALEQALRYKKLPVAISSRVTLSLIAPLLKELQPELILTGEGTAFSAAQAGIKNAINAAQAMQMREGMEAVAACLRARRIGACYYPAAEQPAFPIAQLEEWSGADIHHIPTYRTVARERLPEEARRGWGDIAAITVGSTRTAAVIGRLVKGALLDASAKTALCRSEEIATILRENLDITALHHDGRNPGDTGYETWLATQWNQLKQRWDRG